MKLWLNLKKVLSSKIKIINLKVDIANNDLENNNELFDAEQGCSVS